ncbi:hypothetical protein EUTSA_v10014307mg [Eutrema salsugineum]|uniref:AT hook motif-containing protein n=1 Tax=Eutrema salsugineum TaxID=72664 RepID=V4KY69_EUTSA|nr:uncharacterized protein LOC18018823 isoform X2 [Eutrema salsugineum]ESQ42960.1 hypothetical protein EUTSA_v10014307mg [Eutrema salsugineum]
MEKESHEENNNNNTISGDFMAKRKRGRPRKHLKLDSNEQSLGPPPGFSRSQLQLDEAMVGQPVSGVIEATFEAGFLLSVKVGNSDSMLRGVVFKPGRCDPVSVDNDVAPDVPMIRRNSDVMMMHHHHHHHHQGSAKGGRKSRFREKRGGASVKSRALVPVPIQPAPHPKHLLVPVLPQHGNLQNGSGRVQMQTEIESQVSGGSNGKPFETLLTQVMKKSEVHHTTQFTEAESEEQALSIEPLQAIHPVHPVHMHKPMASYGRGKMTELLQENVRDGQYSQGQ